MIIGYIRPYFEDDSCEEQLKLLEDKCDRIVQEEHSSAKRRVALYDMAYQLQPGDTVMVSKLYSLADSTRHLMEMLELFDEKQSCFCSLQEEIDTRKESCANFRLMVAHLLEFQSDVISEKTRQGMYEAKRNGAVTGRPRKPDENVKRAITMYESKQYTLADIKNETGISKSTLYRYLEN
ncbi:recombinase family protein [Paenibacillus alvei]|uniref:Recombinase family protein n=1 Tax=Paenibacillus alvei TaxID=44250 RepID=A0AAP7A332_PAEAL|nr:recombinase family protein [Paenibacillus alvei]